MSTAKRPGSRDISDLKARLGLKKKGAQAPAPGRTLVPPPAGVVPPPGRQTGAIPAPPGAPGHVVHAPVPDASDDPFGAMNAMAANQRASNVAVAAAPIVMVDDGRPVASVEKKSGAAGYAKIAAMVLVPLILGMVIGQIGSKAAVYNRTITDSKKVRADVEAVGKRLLAVQNTLQIGQDRGADLIKAGKSPKRPDGKATFALKDPDLLKELEALAPLNPNTEVVFKSFMYDLPPEITKEIFLFYTESAKLAKDLREHLKVTAGDLKIVDQGTAKLGTFYRRRYGGLLSAPAAGKNQPVSVSLVELGLPICEAEGKPNEAGCGSNPPVKYQYRRADGGDFGAKKITTPDGAVAPGQLVYFDIGTPFFQGMIKGGGPTVAEASYWSRLDSIQQRVEILVQVRKNIMNSLNSKAKESTKFDFFMG